MALTITAKGAAGGGSGTATLSSLTISGGATVVACVHSNNTAAGTPACTYNPGGGAVAMTIATGPHRGGSNCAVTIFYLDNVDAATGSGAVSGTDGSDDCSVLVYQITGAAATSSFDKGTGASGRSTAPSSGATTTLSQADEAVVGAITIGYQSVLTWTDPTANTQMNEPENNMQANSAAKVVSATTAQTAYGADSVKDYWSAAVATFKMAAAPTAPVGKSYSYQQAVTTAAYH